jgi:hypothetical protein
LTWHLAAFSNGQLGDSEIWYAVAPTAVDDVKVEGVRAFGGYTGFLDVQTVAGVDPAQPIGSVARGSGQELVVAACPDGKSYTSDAIQMSSFSFTYGTVEFRSKEAGGTGTWPAEWLLGTNCQQANVASADDSPPCAWPNPGSDEIDIAEVFSYDHTMVNEQIHRGVNQDQCLPHVSDVTQNWHTYQLVWSPGSLVWKMTG